MFNNFWFDVETTGLNFYENEILSLAYIIESDGELLEHGVFYAKPDMPENIQPKALEINGFTLEQIKKFPSQLQLYNNIVKLFKKYNTYGKNKFKLCGYNNSACDDIFLRQLFIRYGYKDFEFYDYCKSTRIDVFGYIPLIEELLGKQLYKHKLEDMAKLFKLEHNAHDALSDVIVTYKLYKIIMAKIKGLK